MTDVRGLLAAITPIAADDADTRASWSVTFSTDDADATAAKAVELGGTVLVAPVDAPYSRLTVLCDPQGAMFSATAFVPENKDIGVTSPERLGPGSVLLSNRGGTCCARSRLRRRWSRTVLQDPRAFRHGLTRGATWSHLF